MIRKMKKAHNRTLWFSITSLLFSFIWVGFTYFQNQDDLTSSFSAPQKGFLAPDFELLDLDGKSTRLSNLKGNVVVVNVWASWCKPCQYEMPAMQKIFEEYSEKGFVLLAVNNTVQDNLSDITSFVNENNLNFPILLDYTGEVSKLYRVQALPSTFFIDQNGIIQEIIIGGPMSEALIKSKILEMGIDVPNF